MYDSFGSDVEKLREVLVMAHEGLHAFDDEEDATGADQDVAFLEGLIDCAAGLDNGDNPSIVRNRFRMELENLNIDLNEFYEVFAEDADVRDIDVALNVAANAMDEIRNGDGFTEENASELIGMITAGIVVGAKAVVDKATAIESDLAAVQ